MEFFEEVGRKVGETVKVIGDKSNKMLEIGRINIDIGKEETTIKKLYLQIGEIVYKAHNKGENGVISVDELCQEISQRKGKIDELKNRIADLKS